ncbi:hypothetical protein ES705_30595 [subsurface metagenome]
MMNKNTKIKNDRQVQMANAYKNTGFIIVPYVLEIS